MYLGLLAFVRGILKDNDVQSVDDAGNITKDGQQDVDEEIGIAASLKEDT